MCPRVLNPTRAVRPSDICPLLASIAVNHVGSLSYKTDTAEWRRVLPISPYYGNSPLLNPLKCIQLLTGINKTGARLLGCVS